MIVHQYALYSKCWRWAFWWKLEYLTFLFILFFFFFYFYFLIFFNISWSDSRVVFTLDKYIYVYWWGGLRSDTVGVWWYHVLGKSQPWFTTSIKSQSFMVGDHSICSIKRSWIHDQDPIYIVKSPLLGIVTFHQG